MITFLAFVAVFGLLIFVHELGHFLMARRLGVKVEEFAFGFPPRIWSRKKGDTIYSINLIPIGGFVRMQGEHGEDEDNKTSFASKTKFQKSLILVAGVVMNFLLAVFLLTLIYGIGFRSVFPGMENHIGVINTQKVVVKEVNEDTPANDKLKEGDIITKIDDVNVKYHAEVFVNINELTKEDQDKPLKFTILRDGEEIVEEISTYEDEIDANGEMIKVRMIGVVVETEGNIRTPFYLAPVAGLSEAIRLTGFAFQGMIDFFGTIVSKFAISENVGGPVAIVSATGVFARAGIMPLIQFAAFLSVSLAVLNIIPIPALDGGHILILLVEKVKGKDLSHEMKNMVQFIGFGLLIVLMVVITIRDITGVSVFESIKNLF